MREIKFRGIASCDVGMYGEADIAEGQMIFGQVIFEGATPFIVGKIVEQCEEYVNLEWWCPIKPATLGQFTGLKDANGIEIYEGDICQGVYGKQSEPHSAILSGEVRFSCGGFEIDFPVRTVRLTELNGNRRCLWVERFGYNSTTGYQIIDIKVIGNIHLNPELLAK